MRRHSKTLEIVQVRAKGWQLEGFKQSPFFRIGCINACFQEVGKVLVLKQKKNKRASIGASSEAHAFKIRGGMPFSHYTLLASTERSTFLTV